MQLTDADRPSGLVRWFVAVAAALPAVLTLVADAPGDLVTAVVAALPGRSAVAPGILERVARGWERIAEAAWPG